MAEAFLPLEVTSADGRHGLRACRHGGHLLGWRHDGVEQLFLSARAEYRDGVAIRGGVPICFPQFAGFGPLAKHGFVRTRAWSLLAAESRADAAVMAFVLDIGADEIAGWPHAVGLVVRYSASAQGLECVLEIENPGATPLSFTGALHTYLAVSDLEAVTLRGLGDLAYTDSARGGEAVDTETCLRFGPEIDRIYHAAAPVLLQDRARSLGLAMEGFTDTVVWNPGPVKGPALADLAPGDWRRFVCIEAGVIARPVRLPPGEHWRGSQYLIPGAHAPQGRV